ncbi:hypothetical protein PoMZ_11315, partial [Pyricularia oryzae]
YPARSGEAFYWIPGGQLCPYRLQCRTRYSEISAVFVRGETFFGELGSLGQDKKRPDDEKLGPFHHHSEPEIQPHCLAARSRPQEGLSPERKNGKNRIQRPARQHVLSVLQPPASSISMCGWPVLDTPRLFVWMDRGQNVSTKLKTLALILLSIPASKTVWICWPKKTNEKKGTSPQPKKWYYMAL